MTIFFSELHEFQRKNSESENFIPDLEGAHSQKKPFVLSVDEQESLDLYNICIHKRDFVSMFDHLGKMSFI